MSQKYNLAIFGSGVGSNFDSIQKHISNNKISSSIKLVVSNKKKSLILQKAKKLSMPSIYIPYKNNHESSNNFHSKVLKKLNEYKIDFIILAGFMKIIKEPILTEYKNRILNIHPSLLPSHKGSNACEKAINNGDKFTGTTVHIVDENIDGGKILFQKKIPIHSNDTPDSLHQRIKKAEHIIYPNAIENYILNYFK